MHSGKDTTRSALLSGQCDERLRVPVGIGSRQVFLPMVAERIRAGATQDCRHDGSESEAHALLCEDYTSVLPIFQGNLFCFDHLSAKFILKQNC